MQEKHTETKDSQATDDDSEYTNQIGKGYDTIVGEEKNFAINFSVQSRTAEEAPSIRRFDYIDSVSTRLQNHYLNAWASFSAFKGNQRVEVNYLSITDVQKYFTNYQVFDISREFFFTIIINPQQDIFKSGVLDRLRDDPSDFHNLYGDSFISRVHVGGFLYFDFAQRRSLKSIYKKIDGDFDFDIGPVTGSVEMGEQVTAVTKTRQFSYKSSHNPPIAEGGTPQEIIDAYFATLASGRYAILGYDFEPYSSYLSRYPDLRSKIDLHRRRWLLEEMAKSKEKLERKRNLLSVYVRAPEVFHSDSGIEKVQEAFETANDRIEYAEATAETIMDQPFETYDDSEILDRIRDDDVLMPDVRGYSLPIRLKGPISGSGRMIYGGTLDRRFVSHDHLPWSLGPRLRRTIRSFSVSLRHPIRELWLEKRLVFTRGSTGWTRGEVLSHEDRACCGFKLRLRGANANMFRIYAAYQSFDGVVKEHPNVNEDVEFGYWHGGVSVGECMKSMSIKISTRFNPS